MIYCYLQTHNWLIVIYRQKIRWFFRKKKKLFNCLMVSGKKERKYTAEQSPNQQSNWILGMLFLFSPWLVRYYCLLLRASVNTSLKLVFEILFFFVHPGRSGTGVGVWLNFEYTCSSCNLETSPWPQRYFMSFGLTWLRPK